MSRARALRRASTDPERRLWRALRARQLLGAKFRRQEPFGAYVLDFVRYGAKLVVEVDGGQHAELRATHDARRTRVLEGEGFTVLRFWNNEVRDNLEGVLDAIARALAAAPPHPAGAEPRPPSPTRGEG